MNITTVLNHFWYCIFKITLICIIFFVFNNVYCSKVEAVTITINSAPASIDSTDSYQVDMNISGAVNATNYLRVDLYKDGTTNYFGETFNGSDWSSGSDGKSYFPVQIQNSSASAVITFRIGNPDLTEYSGPGTYKLKIRRYTSSGNSASDTDSEASQDIQITYIFPTATPTSTPTPEPTKTSTPTPAPTPTKTPTPLPTKTSTPTPSFTLNPTESPEDFISTGSGVFLAIEDTPAPTAEKTDPTIIPSLPGNKNFTIALIFVGLGIALIGGSFYWTFKTSKSSKLENDI